ncbi:MAG: hypothetical protein HY074_12140 [Deltaproteobacteria bacterium]|nr:hypothetical protein [Deltaproteobacteria bacterium]
MTREGNGGGDEQENITVHSVPLRDVKAWLKNKSQTGYAIDPKIYAGLYWV